LFGLTEAAMVLLSFFFLYLLIHMKWDAFFTAQSNPRVSSPTRAPPPPPASLVLPSVIRNIVSTYYLLALVSPLVLYSYVRRTTLRTRAQFALVGVQQTLHERVQLQRNIALTNMMLSSAWFQVCLSARLLGVMRNAKFSHYTWVLSESFLHFFITSLPESWI
jgi:hypothetical protein